MPNCPVCVCVLYREGEKGRESSYMQRRASSPGAHAQNNMSAASSSTSRGAYDRLAVADAGSEESSAEGVPGPAMPPAASSWSLSGLLNGLRALGSRAPAAPALTPAVSGFHRRSFFLSSSELDVSVYSHNIRTFFLAPRSPPPPLLPLSARRSHALSPLRCERATCLPLAASSRFPPLSNRRTRRRWSAQRASSSRSSSTCTRTSTRIRIILCARRSQTSSFERT